jgi:hypothetical protein
MTATAPPARPAHTERELLDAIAAAARHQHPDDPASLSQATFDAIRGQVQPAGLPTAKSIARRFGVPWRRLVEIALQPPRRHTALLGRRSPRYDEVAPSLGQILVALRQAAIRLNATTISRTTYEQARDTITAAAARARAPGTDRNLMPSLQQIDGVLAASQLSWSEGCTRAGLTPPDPTISRVQALDADAAVVWFAENTGTVPATFNQLDNATSRAGVARKRMRWADITAAIARLQAQRAADALPALEAEHGDGPLERINAIAIAADAPRRRPKAWTGPTIIEGLTAAIRLLPTGDRLTQRALKRLAVQYPEVPSYSVVHRHATRADTTFEALIREAEKLLRASGNE